MNRAFFLLPADKQEAIMQAGYEVFGRTPYAKAKMSDLAWKAGVSKSLLFYYFKNKRELYVFLWNEAARLTHTRLCEGGVYEGRSLFQMMVRGMDIKLNLMRESPALYRFCLRAFLETDPEVRDTIQASYSSWFSQSVAQALGRIEPGTGIPGVDPAQILEHMALAFEGYLRRVPELGNASADVIEKEFGGLMAFWIRVFASEQDRDIRYRFLKDHHSEPAVPQDPEETQRESGPFAAPLEPSENRMKDSWTDLQDPWETEGERRMLS